jgi:starvation-inducible outer membrane lipoprotein
VQGVDETVTPRQSSAAIGSLHGDNPLWGGTIANNTILEGSTRLELLAYPLDGEQSQTSTEAVGRFMAIELSYLGTADYCLGRLMTVKGSSAETREGAIGEALRRQDGRGDGSSTRYLSCAQRA